jgi:hypothetical protein
MKKYPDTPLKKQVRSYDQTQSAFDAIVAALASKEE